MWRKALQLCLPFPHENSPAALHVHSGPIATPAHVESRHHVMYALSRGARPLSGVGLPFPCRHGLPRLVLAPRIAVLVAAKRERKPKSEGEGEEGAVAVLEDAAPATAAADASSTAATAGQEAAAAPAKRGRKPKAAGAAVAAADDAEGGAQAAGATDTTPKAAAATRAAAKYAVMVRAGSKLHCDGCTIGPCCCMWQSHPAWGMHVQCVWDRTADCVDY